jgi:hypothetical protein
MATCGRGRRQPGRLAVLMCLAATGCFVAEAVAHSGGYGGGAGHGGGVARTGVGGGAPRISSFEGGDASYSGISRSLSGAGRSFSDSGRSFSGASRSFSSSSRLSGGSAISRAPLAGDRNMASSVGMWRGSSISPPADFHASQARIGSDFGSRRTLSDRRSYSISRGADAGSVAGSGEWPTMSRLSRSAGAQHLDISRPSLGSHLRNNTPAEAGSSRSSAPSSDSISRHSINRDSAVRAPVVRDTSGAGGAGGLNLNGSDSVGTRISRPPGVTARNIHRSVDSPPAISRDVDSSPARTKSGGQRVTRVPETIQRPRTLDASERITRRTDVSTVKSAVNRISRDVPISRTLDGVSRNATDHARIAVSNRSKVTNSTIADALSIRPSAAPVRALSRTSTVKTPIDAVRVKDIRRSTDFMRKATSVKRVDPVVNRTSFARNAGSQLARSAANKNDIVLAAKRGAWDGEGRKGGHGGGGHGGNGYGGWGYGGGKGHGHWEPGWHGKVYGWYGHHRWYFHDYHWCRPRWWHYGFSFGYWGGPWHVDWGFRYAYPWCSPCGYWPPATVYYSYTYSYWDYPPVVYTSVCYTPFYTPVYYATPVVPVFPSYYYPAYSVAYYNPSLYYAPPATDLGGSYGTASDWGPPVDSSRGVTDAAAVQGSPSQAMADASAAQGEANLDMGLKALQAGEVERSRTLLAQAVNADPNNGVARMLYTAALVADGQYKDASLWLRDSLQVWGDVQLKDFYLPNVYGDSAAQAQYLRDLRAFLSDHPDALDGWLLTIWSYAFSGQTQQAANLLAEARKTWPDDPALAKLDAIVRFG